MNEIELSEVLPIITEVISGGGLFTICPKGTSMLPTLKAGRDSVSLGAPENLKVGDIVLYRRKNGAFVLHRIVKKSSAGFDFLGDNQVNAEKNVPSDAIIAVVSKYVRRGKTVLRGSFTFGFQRITSRMITDLKYFLGKIKKSIKNIVNNKFRY